MQIETVAIIARKIQRDILFPEIAEEIAELKKTIEEVINQLEVTLEMWSYLGYNIESEVRKGTPLFYSTRNKLAEWHNKLRKE
jgi:hypothetical protein